MSRIVIVTPVYLPYRAGMAHVANEEAERLAARGHEVHVVTRSERGVPTEETIEGVKVHRWRSCIKYGKAGWIPFLYSRVSKLNPDIVHLHLPFFGVQELTRWPRKVRLVVTYHMDITVGGFVGIVSQISRSLFLGRLLRRAEKIFVASLDYAKTSWLNDVWSSIGDKIVEAPFGVDIQRFNPDSDKPDREKCELLFVGALDRAHPFKGVKNLLTALEAIKERDDWHLTLVGGGDSIRQHKEMVQQLKLESKVTFTGRVSDEELPARYRKSDLFVFPSTSRAEAFGLVALEAQASGLPVIASNLDGVRTVVKNNASGWLVEPGNVDELQRQIEWAIENKDAVRAAGLEARENVGANFTWKKHIDKLERVYNEVINK